MNSASRTFAASFIVTVGMLTGCGSNQPGPHGNPPAPEPTVAPPSNPPGPGEEEHEHANPPAPDTSAEHGHEHGNPPAPAPADPSTTDE